MVNVVWVPTDNLRSDVIDILCIGDLGPNFRLRSPKIWKAEHTEALVGPGSEKHFYEIFEIVSVIGRQNARTRVTWFLTSERQLGGV